MLLPALVPCAVPSGPLLSIVLRLRLALLHPVADARLDEDVGGSVRVVLQLALEVDCDGTHGRHAAVAFCPQTRLGRYSYVNSSHPCPKDKAIWQVPDGITESIAGLPETGAESDLPRQ